MQLFQYNFPIISFNQLETDAGSPWRCSVKEGFHPANQVGSVDYGFLCLVPVRSRFLHDFWLVGHPCFAFDVLHHVSFAFIPWEASAVNVVYHKKSPAEICGAFKRCGRDSNSRPSAWQADILTSWTTAPGMLYFRRKRVQSYIVFRNLQILFKFFLPLFIRARKKLIFVDYHIWNKHFISITLWLNLISEDAPPL